MRRDQDNKESQLAHERSRLQSLQRQHMAERWFAWPLGLLAFAPWIIGMILGDQAMEHASLLALPLLIATLLVAGAYIRLAGLSILTSLMRGFIVALVVFILPIVVLLAGVFLTVGLGSNDRSMLFIPFLILATSIIWLPFLVAFTPSWLTARQLRRHRSRYEVLLLRELARRVPGLRPEGLRREANHTEVQMRCHQDHPLSMVLAYAPQEMEMNAEGWKAQLPFPLDEEKAQATVIYLPLARSPGPPVLPAGKRSLLVFGEENPLFAQLALLCRGFEGQRRGKEAEEVAYESLREALPPDWTLARGLWLPELRGETDLFVQAPDGRMWLIEVKSYRGPVTYQDGSLKRGAESWQEVLEQLRKQAQTSGLPVILWQPLAEDSFAKPVRLEGKIYHHRGDAQALARFLAQGD